ncbi:MAG: hybrid sensor histidine kinase/response regulator [Gammaproteobacteria bacterium]|nr:hybrid sensor histidine kinase/response regulator [Gammaproteobacteria bacterium]
MAVVASSSAFAQVIRTEELRTRFTREPDFESESRALVELAQALASNPRQILDRLVQSALDLCRAGSTGISILDSETGGDPDQFRWHALAGAWTDKYLGSLLPRDHSPCGVVLSRNSVQLMTDPAKYYDYVSAMDPPCREVLLVPFSVGGVPIGTLWAVMHDESRHFDAEDARILGNLAKFASAGYQSVQATEALEAYGNARAREVRTLSDADKSKDEFIAIIAHELRNPLGSIRNTSALLVRASSDPTVVARAAEVIERQSSAIARLIDDLLDVSRIRLGILDLHRSKVRLVDVLRAALDSSRLSAHSRSHEVEMHLTGEAIYVDGDPLRLTQILGNLLNNAAKYSDANGHVSIRLSREGNNAVVAITDDGIGVSTDKIDFVFDLFAQGGQAGSPRSQGGLGIGLHLARRLVEAHGGVLKATSPGVGCGSTFTVQLPCI